MKSVVLLFVSD